MIWCIFGMVFDIDSIIFSTLKYFELTHLRIYICSLEHQVQQVQEVQEVQGIQATQVALNSYCSEQNSDNIYSKIQQGYIEIKWRHYAFLILTKIILLTFLMYCRAHSDKPNFLDLDQFSLLPWLP